jgi:hypothetical protein
MLTKCFSTVSCKWVEGKGAQFDNRYKKKLCMYIPEDDNLSLEDLS